MALSATAAQGDSDSIKKTLRKLSPPSTQDEDAAYRKHQRMSQGNYD